MTKNSDFSGISMYWVCVRNCDVCYVKEKAFSSKAMLSERKSSKISQNYGFLK